MYVTTLTELLRFVNSLSGSASPYGPGVPVSMSLKVINPWGGAQATATADDDQAGGQVDLLVTEQIAMVG